MLSELLCNTGDQINVRSVELMWENRTNLAKESHSEVGAEQSLARVHDLRHFTVCTMQRVIQVGQFLCRVLKKIMLKICNLG